MSAGKYNNILSLGAGKAMDFFMDSARYCGFELPEHFEFNPLFHKTQRFLKSIFNKDSHETNFGVVSFKGDRAYDRFFSLRIDSLFTFLHI